MITELKRMLGRNDQYIWFETEGGTVLRIDTDKKIEHYQPWEEGVKLVRHGREDVDYPKSPYFDVAISIS